jgi:hypothetical protein
VLARIYPEAGEKGRGKKTEAAKCAETAGFSARRLQEAREIVRWTPDLAEKVLARIYPEAEKGGRGKKTEAGKVLETSGFSQARLQEAREIVRHGADLADQVRPGKKNEALTTSAETAGVSYRRVAKMREISCVPKNAAKEEAARLKLALVEDRFPAQLAALRDEINMLRVEIERLRAEVTAFTQSDEDLPADDRISILRMAHRRGCSRDTIERMCKTGLLDAVKCRNRWRIKPP